MPPKGPPSPSPSGSSHAASSSSSSEEEEQPQQQVEEEEEDEASEDSDSPPKLAAKPTTTKTATSKPNEAATPSAKPPASESESSESDANPPPPRRTTRGADPSIKPISSKPMDGASKSKKASSQQGTEKKKRKEPEPAEEEEATGNGVSGKKLFQRVWTEEDEIAVLKGMIQAKDRGEEPETAIDAFLKFIHKSLHSEFSKTQLADKMRRLKKKYETNLHRSKKEAESSFAKPHDQAVFELSKKIWGGDVNRHYGNDDMEVENLKEEGEKAARQKSVPASVVASPWRDGGVSAVVRGSLVDGNNGEGKAGVLYPKLKEAVTLLEGGNAGCFFPGSLSEKLDLLKPEKANALEEKWRKHFKAGLKYLWERSELKEDLLKLLYEAAKNA